MYPESQRKNIKIVDIASGYNSMIALSEDQEVYVWGRRMGVYPQVNFDLKALQ